MPSFLAINPERMACPSLQLDLDIDAGGEVELHQRVDRLRRRVDDVENPLMRTDLELLATLLVNMRPTQNRLALDAGRQRNRTAHQRSEERRGRKRGVRTWTFRWTASH